MLLFVLTKNKKNMSTTETTTKSIQIIQTLMGVMTNNALTMSKQEKDEIKSIIMEHVQSLKL